MTSAFSHEQLDRYCHAVRLPAPHRKSANPRRDLDLLTALHVFQISAIPYENLSLHYSTSRIPSLDPQFLFEKLLRNGRGGYCMENNLFFLHVLLGFGFHVYPVGVRVRARVNGVPGGDYSGWVHIVNIVTLDSGARYMIDVGFGGDGATKPIPLEEGVVTRNIGAQELRMLHDNIPPQTQRDKKVWIYQYRNGPDLPWNSFFSFSDSVEFLPQDFEVMNYFTSTNSFQMYTVLVIKFLRREDEGAIYGKVMLVNGEVKQNLGGKTAVVAVCRTETERVEALKRYFGITLTDDEVQAIRGRSVELPP